MGHFWRAILWSGSFGSHPILQGPPKTNHFIFWNTSLWAEKEPGPKTLFHPKWNRRVCLSCSQYCQVSGSPSHSPSQVGLIYLCHGGKFIFYIVKSLNILITLWKVWPQPCPDVCFPSIWASDIKRVSTVAGILPVILMIRGREVKLWDDLDSNQTSEAISIEC